MKSVKVYVNCGLKGGSFVVKHTFNGDYSIDTIRIYASAIENKIRKDYPNAKFVDVLIPTPTKIEKNLLMAIGQEVASGWGAVCTGVKTYPNSVCFECNEYGEAFTTHLSYKDIYKEYKYMFKEGN